MIPFSLATSTRTQHLQRNTVPTIQRSAITSLRQRGKLDLVMHRALERSLVFFSSQSHFSSSLFAAFRHISPLDELQLRPFIILDVG